MDAAWEFAQIVYHARLYGHSPLTKSKSRMQEHLQCSAMLKHVFMLAEPSDSLSHAATTGLSSPHVRVHIKPITCHIYCERHWLNSLSSKCLNLFTCAASPVTIPLATSMAPPIAVLRLTAYCAVFAVILITPMRGSSGPPSCLPSPRSPSQALSEGE